MRVGYLGPPGTFSYEALRELAGEAAWELVPCASVAAAIIAAQDGTVDRALVPLENTLEGSVDATLDALVEHAPDVVIAGEVVHSVSHCLIAAEPAPLQAIAAVLSHPQATAQCAGFLRECLPGAAVLPAASTAEAVRQVMERRGAAPVWAAIGPRAAARLYGGRELSGGIEDVHGNRTRFAWLAPAGSEPLPGDERWKTALVWWGAGSGSPGWLVRCLSEFAFRGVNLTRIESRPQREAAMGEYLFVAELDGRSTEAELAAAIEGLRAQAGTVRVLGSFRAATDSNL